jgi:hypothetical protein
MVFRSVNAHDAVFAVYVRKGSKARHDFIAECLGLRFGDDAIPLPPADVEPDKP